MTDYTTISIRLLAACLAGALIGVERAYHGRPAGLRTHTLVCTSSSLLMLLTVFQLQLMLHVPVDIVRVDPTRMAQGIMTGIGFLGAGVIMKEQFTIRGLTTAASVWMTASIGIMIGMGFYVPAVLATFITLMVLSVLGWVEKKLPSRCYGKLTVRFRSREVMTRGELTRIISAHSFKGSIPSYELMDEGHLLEYRMTIHSNDPDNFQRLADQLSGMEQIYEFSIIPSGV